MAFESSGTTYGVANFQVTCHKGDDVENIIQSTIDRIDKEFSDYNQYRVVSIQYRTGNNAKRLMIQEPSTESFNQSKAAEKLSSHLKKSFQLNLPPVVLEIRLFVSYDEPKV